MVPSARRTDGLQADRWPISALCSNSGAAVRRASANGNQRRFYSSANGETYSLCLSGAGHLTSLPLDARQHEEFFLTAAQSLFGIGLLLRLRLGLAGASALATLFIVQVALAVIWQGDEPRIVTSVTWLAWGYLVLSAALFITNFEALVRCSG